VGTGDGLAAAAVVEQRVDRLLQHPLLVADDDLRRVELLQPLEPVVPVDHAAVQVVELGGGEAAAVERHQRAQVRRDDRDDLEHHPLRLVAGLAERLDHLQPLGDLLPLGLRGHLAHLGAQRLGQGVDVGLLEHAEDRLGAHAGLERVVADLIEQLGVPLLGQELAQLQAGLLRVHHDVRLAVEDLLQLLERDVEDVADPARQRLEEPDVGDRRGQRDVAHPLAPDLGLDHLDAALLADHAAVLHALVLAAVALVVLDRPEDLGAEEPVPLWLEGAVVDGLGLLHLAVGPLADLLRRREHDADRAERARVLRLLEEVEDVLHVGFLSLALGLPYARLVSPKAYAPPTFSATSRASAARPAGTDGAVSALRGALGSSISSTLRQSDCSSLSSTLNDSGRPASSTCSPLTIDSYMRVRPRTSSDLTVRNSCSA